MTGGVHLSVGCEERAKAAWLEALPHEEDSNRVRHHRRAGRPRGRGLVRRGGAAGWKEKKGFATTGPKGRMGRNLRRIISE
jgi:hypothetical protein